jgi:hypothetical protein
VVCWLETSSVRDLTLAEPNHERTLFHLLTRLFVRMVPSSEQASMHLTQSSRHSIVLSTITDLTRSRAELIAENAVLAKNLIQLVISCVGIWIENYR